MATSTEQRLDSDIELDSQPLHALTGEDPTEVEVLGYAVMYTVGDVRVPRKWLVNRASELDIPEYLWPNKTRPSSAYKRAIARLEESNGHDMKIDGYDVSVHVEEGDGRYIKHLTCSVLFPEDEVGVEGGKLVHHNLGHFNYDADSQSVMGFMDDEIGPRDEKVEIWEEYYNRLLEFFEAEQRMHNGHQIRQMIYYAGRDHADTVVALRDAGAVYFYPADLADTVEALSQLYQEINEQYKTGGKRCGINTMPILDTEEQRGWVKERVRSTIHEGVDKVLEEAVEEVAEGEATAQEVVNTVAESLESSETMAEQYNRLLDAELEVEKVLENQYEATTDEVTEQVLEEVLDNLF